MITLPALFIAVYAICIVAFLMMPKKAFVNVIKRYMDKNFNFNDFKNINTTAVNYYRIVLLGAVITAALITFVLKEIFY